MLFLFIDFKCKIVFIKIYVRSKLSLCSSGKNWFGLLRSTCFSSLSKYSIVLSSPIIIGTLGHHSISFLALLISGRRICGSSSLAGKCFIHTVGRDVPNSHFQLRDEKTRLSVPGYKNSGTKDRQNRSFSFQGQCTQKHVKYWNSGTKRHDFYRFWKNFNIKTDFFLKITSGSTRNFSHLLSNSGDEQVTCLACKILTRTILTQS